jgi:REP element-mobilizing transposase RayT
MNTLATFEEGMYYHVYNRTNNQEGLFLSVSNRFFIKNLFIRYLKVTLDICAYSLLGNHFHLCIKVKEIETIINELKKIEPNHQTKTIRAFIKDPDKPNAVHTIVSHQFSRFFVCYSKSYNAWHDRVGNLFNRPFKRAKIFNTYAFKLKIYYVHHNARKHKIVTNFEDHPWNSYHEIVINESNIINLPLILELFSGINSFKKFHQEYLLPEELSFGDLTGL